MIRMVMMDMRASFLLGRSAPIPPQTEGNPRDPASAYR
jgi:hypothetical protein